MQQGYSLSNALVNMTKRQKIGIALFLVVVVFLIIVLFMVIGMPREDSVIEENSSEEVVEVKDEPIVLEDGITGVELVNGGTAVAQVPVSAEYNEDHEYTLIDYIPAANYEYVNYGDGQTGIKNYWWVTENTAIEKGIIVSANSCDVEGNTAAANEFLKGLPVDLSDYVIVYQVHESAVPCNV